MAAFGPKPGGDVGPDVCVCVYNQGYKALSLLITILASVAMNRLLSRGPLGIGSVRVCACACIVCACT